MSSDLGCRAPHLTPIDGSCDQLSPSKGQFVSLGPHFIAIEYQLILAAPPLRRPNRSCHPTTAWNNPGIKLAAEDLARRAMGATVVGSVADLGKSDERVGRHDPVGTSR
ncbi:MAG: hypothetical protein JWP74_4208 [Marmoricola sp.]|nr:hypothetical protein [Marmoricola sp.]